MKKYYTALAFVLFLFTANSQSIQYYSNCVDYYGDASNQSNETNVEFINRIFGVNYSSIPTNTNPGHITGSFLGCRASLSSCQDQNCNSTSAANTHKGIDIKANAGTPVYTPIAGIVDRSDPNCDDRVIIKDINDNNLKLIFLHLNSVTVTHGSIVTVGTQIGTSGTKYSTSSGCGTVSAHLHVELRYTPNNNASATCVSCSNNYDPRLIVKLYPNKKVINDGIEIYGGKPTNLQNLKIWFKLPSINNNSFTISNVQLQKSGSNPINVPSINCINKEGCNGIGRFAIQTSSLSGFTPNHNDTYDISFDINGVQFFGKNQVYFFDPAQFNTELSTQSWLKDFVNKGVEYGFFKGTSSTTFSPSSNLTRGQAAKVVTLAALKLGTIQMNTSGAICPNLSPTHWSFPFMQTLYNSGVISVGNPDANIDAAQFAKMLVLAFGLSSSDINSNTVNNATGIIGSKLNLTCYDPSLQQYVDILNKIMLVKDLSGRYKIEPLVSGLYNVQSSILPNSLINADGSNLLNRSLMAKTLIQAYDYYRDKIGNSNPCQAGPQLLNIFNNDFSSFTVIGDKFELTSTPIGSANILSSSTSISMESGEQRIFGMDDDAISGFPVHSYWSVDGGNLISLFPNNNHKKVQFTAPFVTTPTDITLYRYVGVGNGMSAEIYYNITVYPTGQSPNTTAPTIQSSNLVFNSSTNNSISLSWTRGNGQRCIVTCTELGANAIDAPDPGVIYTGNSNFNLAPFVFGGSDSKVIYTGTGSSLTVTNLLPNTSYRFAVYEYNGNTPQVVQYRLSNPAYGVASTLPNTSPPSPPSAWFTWVNPVVTGQSVTFSNQSSGATNYSWSFQSGSPSTSTSTNPSVSWSTAGTYNVVLTASNSQTGLSDQLTSQITILNPSAILPDFFIPTASANSNSFVINSNATINYAVSNQGYSYTNGQPIHTKFYLSLNNILDGGDYYFTGGDFAHNTNVNPGTTQNGSASLNLSNSITLISNNGPGQYYLIVFVDGAQAVNESNESNNYYAIPITLVNGLPNLSYSNQSASPTTIQSGGTTTATWNLRNTSTTTPLNQQNIGIGYFLSTDNQYSIDDITIAYDYPYNSIPANSFIAQNKALTIPSFVNSGSYFLIVVIDYNNDISETNENDNSYSIPIVISNPTQPTIQASNIRISNIANTSCRISWTNGNGNARVVVASTGKPIYEFGNAYNGAPRDGISYTANANFTLAQSINTNNPPVRVVYDGTGSFVDVTSLTTNSDYFFTVFEYNNTGNGKDYLISHNTVGANGNGYYKGAVAKICLTPPFSNGFYKLSNQYMSEQWTKSVQFINDSIGWTVHDETFYKTSDGGITWSYVNLNVDQNVNYLLSCYTSGITGWAGGTGGSLFQTTDGGNTWTKISIPTNDFISAIQFADVNNGYVVSGDVSNGINGRLFKTTNGGSSWQQILSTPYSLINVDVKGNTIVVSGTRGTVMKSVDGGSSWTTHNVATTGGNVFAVNLLSETKIRVIREGVSSLYNSTNGGNTWQQVTTPVTTPNYASFLNSSFGWIGGGSNHLAKTINGGSSFTSYNNSLFGSVYEISTISEKTAYVFTTNGVFKTISGGENVFVHKPTYSLLGCSNSSLRVKFAVNQQFNSGNIFQLQLSDTSGNFSSPIIIGTKQSVTSDSIDWLIPANIIPSSSYRIRVVASNPSYISEIGNTISLVPFPNVNVTLPRDTFFTNESPLALNSGFPSGGIYKIDGVNSVSLNPASLSIGNHTLSYTVETGSSYTYSSPHLNSYNGGMTGNVTFPRCDNNQNVTYTNTVGLEMMATSLNQGNFIFQIRKKDFTPFSTSGVFEVRDLATGNCWYSNTTAGATTIQLTANVSNFTGVKHFMGLFRSSSAGNNFHADTVSVTGTMLQGCQYSASKPFIVLPAPTINITSITPQTVCPGQSITLNHSSTGILTGNIYTVQLSDVNGNFANANSIFSFSGGNGSNVTNVNIPLNTNVGSGYRLRIVSSYPQSVSNISNTLTVNSTVLPSISINASSTSICQGQQIQFTSTGTNLGNLPIYNWLLNGISTGITNASFSSTNLQSGDVVSVVLTSNASCAYPATVTSNTITPQISPVLTPYVYLVNEDDHLCSGSSALFFAYGSNVGNSPLYEWFYNGNLVSGNSTETQLLSNLSPNDVLKVRVTSSEQCLSSTFAMDSLLLPIIPLPVPIINSNGITSFCSGNSVTLSSSIQGASYLWSNNATAQSITVSTAGNYSVQVTDANGCSGTSPAISITENPLPTPTVNASGATTFCSGNSVMLSSSITGASYLWNNNATTQSISVSTSGNYSVQVTDVNGCTGTSAAISITENPLPTPTVNASGATTFCSGNSVMLSSSITGASYLWNNNSTSQSISVSTTGNYSVQVTDVNGCTGTSPAISVTENVLPTVDAGNAVAILVGNSVVIGGNPTATGNAPFTYNWTPTTGLDLSNVSNPTASPQDTTVYNVVVTDANGCSSIDSITVFVDMITGIAAISNLSGLVVFPNPTNELLNVVGVKVENGAYYFELKNLMGQIIYFDRIIVSNQSLEKQFSLSEMTSGMYFLTIENNKTRTVTKVQKTN